MSAKRAPFCLHLQTKFVCKIAAASECLGPSPQTFEIADKSAGKSAGKVCLDLCLTNLFKNADARAAKIVQNADKSCLPKLQKKFVYSRQGLSILELALYPKPRLVAQAHGKAKMGTERPISTPHLGVYSPPKHAPSITPTIPDNPHNVSQIMRARGAW